MGWVTPPKSSGPPPSEGALLRAFGLLVLLVAGFLALLWLTGNG